MIIDENGREVQGNYRITPASFLPGTLNIYKKGSGQIDPNTGGELPLRITALDQSFMYNGTARGVLGKDLAVDPAHPLVAVQELLPGHRLARVTLSGQQRTNPGVYPGALIPSDPEIVDQNGRDVTGHYRIEPTSFVPGTLTIHPKGSGDGSGSEPESPLVIRAADQHYIYNGALQGRTGKVFLAEDPQRPAATVVGLLPGHKLLSVTLDGAQQRFPNTYRDALTPTQVQIVDAAGVEVTRFYNLAPEGFAPGALIIHPKGNGVPDGKGGELPLVIAAQEQAYSYSGKPRGKFGSALKNAPGDLWAVAEGLLPGDKLYWIGLYGTRRTARGRYTDAITPGNPVIHGGGEQDVTWCYLITQESFVPADLVIGSGSGNGGALGGAGVGASEGEEVLTDFASPLGIDPNVPFQAYPNLSARDVGDGLE